MLTIRPTVVKRTICKNDWWINSRREYIYYDEFGENRIPASDHERDPTELTYPLLYQTGRNRIELEQDDLLRYAQTL